ncbi:MAG TPA: P27 family phage terminase small subunit [Solirubrobacterales bacterium]|jgi:P27 family predicted phage terminase small subunit|nr:P27 family phage terminase small subunit [Solirubrobacterales bacterium]
MASTTPALPKAPGHLSAKARKLWDSIVDRYDLEDEGLATLTLALEALDVAATARRRLKDDGQIVEDRFGQLKPHPAVAIHRDALATWRQLVTLLGIHDPGDDEPQGRDRRGQYRPKGSASRSRKGTT